MDSDRIAVGGHQDATYDRDLWKTFKNEAKNPT